MGAILGKMSRLSLVEDPPQSDSKENSNEVSNNEHLNTPKKYFIADHLLDPRSATAGIKRTPVILAKVDNETPIKPKPYLETDLDELGVEAEENNLTVNNEVVPPEMKHDITPELECLVEDSSSPDDESVFQAEEELPSTMINPQCQDNFSDDEIINVEGKIVNSPAVNKLKVARSCIIYEDDAQVLESTPVKPKAGRAPLGLVSTNSSPIPSPLGGKHWLGIREERIRLGLENTPPNVEPYLATVQSAPGKVGTRRAKKALSRTAWAQDESLVI